jgi:hypothetical protein
MFAAIMLAASLAPPAAPAPLPDRWLLKLVPEKLPPLPDRFYGTTWYAASQPVGRFGPPWELWAGFRKASIVQPAEAILTLPVERQSLGVGFGGLPFTGPTTAGHNTVPLAVHGSLVEFDRKLYTATIRTRRAIHGRQTECEMLHLGSAIEFEKGAWYQAGTSREPLGDRVVVEEWRIDFKDDPRAKARGTAHLRGRWRVLTEPNGKSLDAEVSFHAVKSSGDIRNVTLQWPTGMQQSRRLPSLEFDDVWDGRNYMQLDGMHWLSLEPATKPRPKLPDSHGLVQPPMKAARK